MAKIFIKRKKKKVWRNDKNQISCTPSKQSDWLLISSPCYFVSTSKSIYSTSLILLLVEHLLNGVYREKFIYKKKKKKNLIWIWAKFLNPNYFSSGTTSTSILPLCFKFRQSISMSLIVTKTKTNIGRKDYINTYERKRNTHTFFF